MSMRGGIHLGGRTELHVTFISQRYKNEILDITIHLYAAFSGVKFISRADNSRFYTYRLVHLYLEERSIVQIG